MGAIEFQEDRPSARGDANRDGRSDSSDMIRVFQAGEYEDPSQATRHGKKATGTETASSTPATCSRHLPMANMRRE